MARGDGSITTDTRTGRKRARVVFNGKRMTLPGSFDDEKQALGALAEFWKGVQAKAPTSAHGLMTVASWGITYLNDRDGDGHHRSVDRDRARWASRIAESSVGRAYIDTLTANDVRAWVKEQIRTPTARGALPAKQTVANALNLLRVALEEAVQAGHIESNPARDVRLPRMAKKAEGWAWLRAAELERLFASLTPTTIQRRIFTVAIFTGLRKGELWGLRWSDVDFDRGELVVARSYRGPTKGGTVRRVQLLKPALEALTAAHKSRRTELVFPSARGGMRTRNDSAGWPKLCKALGIGQARFHDLRHTCASHLVQGTWAPHFVKGALKLADVQRWMGHESARTTERYAHLSDDSIRGSVIRADREPESEGERSGREWTQADLSVSEDAMQLAETIDAFGRRRLDSNERMTVLQSVRQVADTKRISPGASRARPQERDAVAALAEILKAYRAGLRPSDMEVIRAVGGALELASLSSAGRDVG